MVRPSGPLGPVVVTAAGRDLLTTTGDPVELASASLRATVDFPSGRTLVSIDTEPAEPALTSLVGSTVSTGFRAAVAELPLTSRPGDLLWLLLEELPVVTLISAAALLDDGPDAVAAARYRLPPTDTCAGWKQGSWLNVQRKNGVLHKSRVAAPALEVDDPLGWHLMSVMVPGAVRRRRLVDVGPRKGDGSLRVEAMFRDSMCPVGGEELVVHEYRLVGSVGADGVVLDLEAQPRVLPAPECPLAAASARGLVGRRVAEVRPLVTRDFRGTGTCTHLNSALLAFGDVEALAGALDQGLRRLGLDTGGVRHGE